MQSPRKHLRLIDLQKSWRHLVVNDTCKALHLAGLVIVNSKQKKKTKHVVCCIKKKKIIIIIIIIGKVLKMDTLFGVGCDHHWKVQLQC